MNKEMLKYIQDGISINGSPSTGYRVFTIPTQWFNIASLEELTPDRFEEAIQSQKELVDLEDKLPNPIPILSKEEFIKYLKK